MRSLLNLIVTWFVRRLGLFVPGTKPDLSRRLNRDDSDHPQTSGPQPKEPCRTEAHDSKHGKDAETNIAERTVGLQETPAERDSSSQTCAGLEKPALLELPTVVPPVEAVEQTPAGDAHMPQTGVSIAGQHVNEGNEAKGAAQAEDCPQLSQKCAGAAELSAEKEVVSQTHARSDEVLPPIERPTSPVATPVDLPPNAGETSLPSAELEWPGFSERAQRPSEPPNPEANSVEENEEPVQHESDTTEIRKRRSDLRRPPAPIDFSEYAGQVAEPPRSYIEWNSALAAHVFRSTLDKTVILAISPRTLASAINDKAGGRIPPVDAEKAFSEAVAAAYAACCRGSTARLKAFRRAADDGTPLCVGLLALSVLAAHKMHTDEIASSNAYYTRLAGLLSVDLVNGLPADFRTSDFESLWLFLNDWLVKHNGSSLALPETNPQRRYIAYPLANVPLRQLDLEKLPAFFVWAGYSRELEPPPQRIADDLRRWDQSYSSFSEAGRTAISDNRRQAVIAQVRGELRAWDGVIADTEGVLNAQVEILLETAARRQNLFLLAPRRLGYPQVFTAGPVELEAGESWYEPLEIKPTDGNLLENGFAWQADGGPRCVLRRAGGDVFVLGPNPDYSGKLTRLGIPKEVESAVLCRESLSTEVADYLAEICSSAPRAINGNAVPQGWTLFPRVKAIRNPAVVPERLRALEVVSEVMIIPHGGLRVEGRWAWMLGAAPRILVEGSDGVGVFVNDVEMALDEEGFLLSDEVFSKPGDYVVRIGLMSQRIRIVEPSVRPSATDASAHRASLMKSSFPAVLEAGDWTVIGCKPGNVTSISVSGRRPRLAFFVFDPVWVIKLGTKPRDTRVIQLRVQAVDRGRLSGGKMPLWNWASCIRSAANHKPQIEGAESGRETESAESWGGYGRVAQEIMERWRRRQR